MNYRHFLGLCPGSGENNTRLSRESGMRRYNHRASISVGTSTRRAINGFKKIDRNIMGRV